jgi:hypothetical protein
MLRIASRWLFVLLLIPSALTYAKPKTIIKVQVEEEIKNLSSDGFWVGSSARYTTYINVTIVPTTVTSSPLINDGKWCIKSQPNETVHLVKGGEYAATLNGSLIDVEIPQTKGKPLSVTFSVFDHKWRSRLDLR